MDWLCTAPVERVPSSKAKYATEHATTTQTLRNWEKSPAFRDAWKSRVDAVAGSPEKTHDMLEMMYQRGMAGDAKWADLWLRATGRMQPAPLKVESVKSTAELTDSELMALIEQRAGAELKLRGTPVPFADAVEGV